MEPRHISGDPTIRFSSNFPDDKYKTDNLCECGRISMCQIEIALQILLSGKFQENRIVGSPDRYQILYLETVWYKKSNSKNKDAQISPLFRQYPTSVQNNLKWLLT